MRRGIYNVWRKFMREANLNCKCHLNRKCGNALSVAISISRFGNGKPHLDIHKLISVIHR